MYSFAYWKKCYIVLLLIMSFSDYSELCEMAVLSILETLVFFVFLFVCDKKTPHVNQIEIESVQQI